MKRARRHPAEILRRLFKAAVVRSVIAGIENASSLNQGEAYLRTEGAVVRLLAREDDQRTHALVRHLETTGLRIAVAWALK